MNSPSLFFRTARLGAVLLFFATQSIAAAIDLTFPTKNHALIEGDGEAFNMFVDREINGEKTTQWEGGQYGYVRDPHIRPPGWYIPAFTKASTSSRWSVRAMTNRSIS